MVDRVLIGIIMILTLLTAGIVALVVRGEGTAHRLAAEPLRSQVLRPEQWRRLTTGARQVLPLRDSATSTITILTFSDFECPACRRFSRSIGASSIRYPGRIALEYRDYPLKEIHPEAMVAARAGVCANQGHAFAAFYKAVFDAQDSLAYMHWAELARQAGVRDTVRFASCMAGEESARQVARDIALGDSIGVYATPTVIINGLRLSRPPNAAELDSILGASR